MHAEPAWFVIALGLVALLVGGLVLCVLFLFKKTRPVAWLLLAFGIVTGFVLVSYTSVRDRQVAEVSMRRMADARAYQEWLGHEAAPVHEPPVDLEALFQPRIQLGSDTAIATEAEHAEAGSHPDAAHPVEPTEALPPEPDSAVDGTSTSSHIDGEVAAAPSDSAGSFATAARVIVGEESQPPWVEQTPTRDGQTYPVVVVTDPFSSKHEADRQVSQLIMIAASEVVSDLVGHYGPHYPNTSGMDQLTRYQVAVDHLWGMNLTPGTLRNRVWRDEFVEHLDLGLPSGPMLRVHTLLEFDQEFQSELQQRWRGRQARERLQVIGVGAGGVLGILALVWGLLKFDTVTKGYYTKRLVVGSGLLITLLLLLAGLLG